MIFYRLGDLVPVRPALPVSEALRLEKVVRLLKEVYDTLRLWKSYQCHLKSMGEGWKPSKVSNARI